MVSWDVEPFYGRRPNKFYSRIFKTLLASIHLNWNQSKPEDRVIGLVIHHLTETNMKVGKFFSDLNPLL